MIIIRKYILAVTLVIAFILTGCEKIDIDKAELAVQEDNSEEVDANFPKLENVKVIKLYDDNNTLLVGINAQQEIDKLIRAIENYAEPLEIETLEALSNSTQYQLVFISENGNHTYGLTDMRFTESIISSAVISISGKNGSNYSWKLPSDIIHALLFNKDEVKELLLNSFVYKERDRVTIVANQNIMRSSVQQAIEDTLVVSGQEIEAVDYTIYWTDDRRAVVQFNHLSDSASVHFRLDNIQSEDAKKNSNHFYGNQVVLPSYDPFQGLRWVNVNGSITREEELADAVLLQPIRTSNIDENQVIVYHQDDSQHVINVDTGASEQIYIKKWPIAEMNYSNDYGTTVLFSDIIQDNMTYVVRDNRYVYRYNGSDKLEEIYIAERPIYGISASPSNNHIAILIDADDYIGPDADLIVLDKKGNVTQRVDRASRVGKSDGFLFVYPMAWQDEQTVVVPLMGYSSLGFDRGKAYVNLSDHSITTEANFSLPDEANVLLEKYAGDVDSEIFRVLPQSLREERPIYAIQLSSGIWLVNMNENKVSWLGRGVLMQWNNRNELLIWQSRTEKVPAYIGMDIP